MADKPLIKVGHIKITDHLVLGVTMEKLATGEESFQNLDIGTVPFVGWNPLGSALKSDEIDAAFILAPFAMELFFGGFKSRLILFGHRSGSIIIKNKRANIETIEDFRGKTVLIPHYLSVHNLIFERMLREKGLEVGIGKDVMFEVEAPSQIPEIMEWDEKGAIGGFIVAEPFGSMVIKAGFGEEFALSKDIWPNHPCCVLVVKEELVQKYPDAVQEMTTSFVRSGDLIESDPDKASEIGAKFLNQDKDVVKRVLTEPADRVTMGKMKPTLNELEFMQNYLTERIQAMSGRINLQEFVNTQFAEEAGAK